MEFIRRKISLEDGFSRQEGPLYGTLTASSFYVKIMLTQNIDDMGVFDNNDFNSLTPDYTELTDKLIEQDLIFPFMTGDTFGIFSGDSTNIRVSNVPLSSYFTGFSIITGSTDSKIEFFRTYNINTPFIIDFDIEKEIYIEPYGSSVDGRSRITEITGGTTTYTLDANLDSDIGTTSQTFGILYKDFENVSRNISFDNFNNTFDNIIPKTDFTFNAQGFNSSNVDLSAITKSEYLLGISESPKVENDIFIDRGTTSVFDKHMKLGGIFSIQQLEQFGNGEFNLIKQ